MKNSIFYFFNILAICSLCLISNKINAESVSEAHLKTVYLYNFSRFVQWPEAKSNADTFLFCTYLRNRFGKIFYQLEQRKINDKSIQVKEVNSIEDIKLCHAVFIDSVADSELDRALLIAQKNHVLTISDQKKFTLKGGMIQMFVKKNKIRFNINYNSSQKASLLINSKLLELASNVIRPTL